MPVTAELNMSVTGKHTSALDLGTATLAFAKSLSYSLTDGTTAGKADRVFTDTRTLAASATENLDLAASLVDAFGATITFVTVRAIMVVAAAANTNDVQVTRPASNGFAMFMAAGDGVALKPGMGMLIICSASGFPVVATTGDLLTITNSAAGTGVTYDVIIVGTSA